MLGTHDRSARPGVASCTCLLLLFLMALPGCRPTDAGNAVPSHRTPLEWPPRLDAPYPALELKDPEGRNVTLAGYTGKVLLIEPIGISCPACQAFAGGNRPELGGLDGVTPQHGLASIAEYVEQYSGGIRLDDPRLVYVQLLLYDPAASGAPTLEDARRWQTHFNGHDAVKPLVLVGNAEMIGSASYGMIPGFQLVDRDFVLRVDSTGHRPRHDLWRELLPALGEMVGAEPVPQGHQVGAIAPDFTLDDTGGVPVSFSALRGDRPAVVYFYSGCCGHCSGELAKLGTAIASFEQDETAIVGVQYFGDSASCKKKRESHELPGTVLADRDGAVCARFDVKDFTVVTLDSSGVIRYRGELDDLPTTLR